VKISRVLLFLTLTVAILQTGAGQTAATPPVSAGKRIGQVIVDAIGIALPSVKSLIDTLFPASSTKQVTKDAVTKAATDQANTSITQAKAVVKQAATTSAELGVMSQFLEHSAPASQRLARIMVRIDQPLTTGTTLSGAIKPDWSALQDKLKALGNVSMIEINKVQDSGIRLQLVQIRSINANNVGDIDQAITDGRLQDVKDQLRAVQNLLNSVVPVLGIEIVNLQADVDVAVKWASGLTAQSAGGIDPRVVAFRAAFDDNIKAARSKLKK